MFHRMQAPAYYALVVDNVIVAKGTKEAMQRARKAKNLPRERCFVGNTPSGKVGDKWR
jgi:hypothetical protein